MVGEEPTTHRDELKRAKMRRDARELVEAVEDFEETHGEVFCGEEEHHWHQALSGLKKFR